MVDATSSGVQRSLSLQGDYRYRRWQLGGEVRQRDEELPGAASGAATLAGLRLGVDLRPGINLYSLGQVTLDRDEGVEANNLGTLGLRSQLGAKLDLGAEASAGNRGQSARVRADLNLDPNQVLFGTYTLSVDRVDGQRGILSLGQKRTLSNQLRVFTDHQFTHGESQTGYSQSYGLTFSPRDDWLLSASYQQGELTEAAAGAIDRHAVSVGLTVLKPHRRLSLKAELRDDDGAVRRRQWLTTNRLDLDLADGWTVLGKFSFSRTDDRSLAAMDAQFVESGLGFAYRPLWTNRLNILGRYTFLYDLPAAGQSVRADERSHIVSLESGYALTRRWELEGRYALKRQEVREARDGSDWFVSQPNLGVLRARYHLLRRLDAVGEYRWLWNRHASDRRDGALLALYREMTANIELGAGFNATSFSDDLTQRDYDTYGWFVRVLGKY